MGGEIGVKTVVYNTKMDQKKGGGDKNKRKKKKESKRLKKYSSNKDEFCTLDHTTRA